MTIDKDTKISWFDMAFQLKGSVVTSILPRIYVFTLFTTLICVWHFLGNELKIILHIGDLIDNVVYNLVLGLLLVFRTNTSYERFWDGRKSLGILVVNIRNLARFIRLSIPEGNAKDREKKIAVFKLLIAFFIATKLQVRKEKPNEEIKKLLNEPQAIEIDSAKRMSLQISLWIGEYLQEQFKLGKIDIFQRIEMNNLLNKMIEALTSCERISTTPVPIAYRIYLKRLILIYCLALPFNLIEKMQWCAIPIVAIISFILLGLEQVGKELENPFLYGVNDLPMDLLSQNIIGDVESIANFSSEELLPLISKENSLSFLKS
jgi:putative membrane protein